MFKREYYCLIAGLPDLLFGENKSGLNSLSFRNEMEHQLHPADYELVKLLFLPFDNENLVNILFKQNKSFNRLGNLPKNVLENHMENPAELPDYMIQYLKWIGEQETRELNLQFQNKLQSMFYEFVLQERNTFLRNWFKFDLDIKNVLTAFVCRRFKYDVKKQIILLKTNTTVNSLLTNKQLKHELFEDELPFSEQIFRVAESNKSPIEKEKTIDQIRWNYLDEVTFFNYITIEKILSFTIKLNITERWIKLDQKTGKKLLDKLINELKTSYKFPAEFSTIK
jgi:hypothetical protein